MPGSRLIPFTGNLYYDFFMCATVFFIALYFAFVHKSGWGGAVIALMAYWAYILYDKW